MPTLPYHDITLPMTPTPRPRGMLVHTAREIPAELFVDGAADRTGLGAKWLPYGSIVISGDDVTCETTYDKQPRDLPDLIGDGDDDGQPAFVMFDSLICSTLGISLETLASRLNTNLTEFISAFITRELVTATISGGIGLVGNATYTPQRVGNTATSLSVAMGHLQALLNTVQPGARFTIHLTPGLLDRAVAEGLAFQVGNHFETPTGHLVMGDAGFLGSDTPTGGSAATANTEAWIYGTGDIWYRTTPVRGVTEIDSVDGAPVYVPQNKNRPLVERKGIVLFDPNVLAAAKVTL